ncbi:hypothetical protein CRV24_001415 [Beauveria bassiana]|nr:hypothetical protein CRV24_001415 [Beauveria bassiana]KAH8719990.1 hypothetical protein HC256_000397 [Beauveria bassiana]
MLNESNKPFTFSKGPQPDPPSRPPYLSNYVAAGPGIKLNNHGSADTPRNRFDYSVELRQYQQKQEWLASQIEQSMFGDTESQTKVARKWVVDQWQRWGIWNREWPEDGPRPEEPWGNGHPACLLAMELTWEIEHIVTIRQPVDVSKICNTKAPHGSDTPPLNWSWEVVAALAAERLFSRHSQNGFPSTKIEMPSVAFRRDLKDLSGNLSEPVQKLVATVKDWDGLSLSVGTQIERRVRFGDPIGTTHTKPSTLEAGEARKSDNPFGRGLFGMLPRETSTVNDSRARSSESKTVRGGYNAETYRRLFGTAAWQPSTLEAGGLRNSENEQGRGLFGSTYREASPLKASIFVTESGQAFWGVATDQHADDDDRPSLAGDTVWEKNGTTIVGLDSSDNEEAVPTSGRQVKEARSSNDDEAVRTSGRQIEEEQKAEIAEIAASIRAIRGPRRRDLHRKPGEKSVRLTQGGRIKKAYK